MKVLFLSVFLIFTFCSNNKAEQYNVAQYGAKGDGKTVNTKILQDVIDRCSSNGGGTVYVPAGVFVTGTIFMRSHVMLHLEQGAVLRASDNLDDYPGVRNRRGLSFHGYEERYGETPESFGMFEDNQSRKNCDYPH